MGKDKNGEEDHVHYHGVDRVETHITVDEALGLFLGKIRPVGAELVPTNECVKRVLYDDVKSRLDVPQRARSTRDGYALNISEESRIFDVVGDIRIGRSPKLTLKPGQAARVATGSYLPSGTNSVAMVEYVKRDGDQIEVERGQEIGENILVAGADLKKGAVLLNSGARLYPQHVALLAEIGIEKVRVFRKPRIAFLSTGDELFDPLSGGKRSGEIPDITRPFIRSMLDEQGASPADLGIAKDNYDAIKKKIEKGLKSSDALIISAGSSVGERDYALKASGDIPGVKLLVHGVAMRPSSPTGLAIYKGKPFILLPGFPTSAFVSFFVFARAAIAKLGGEKIGGKLEPLIRARMLDAYDGRKGVKHFLRVRVSKKGGEYLAKISMPTEAQYTSWLGSSNGIAVLPEDRATIEPGNYADVFLIGDLQGPRSS